MDLRESEIQGEIRNLARRFAREKLQPVIEADEAAARFRPELIAELGALGLAGVPTSENYGGAGLGYQEYTTVIEELAAVSLGYAISVGVSGMPQLILGQFGTDAQKKKYLPRLATGQAIGAFGLSETSSGSDAGSLKTTAMKKSGVYILNGTKFWITQADVAETFVVMARTGVAGPRGISAFVVEKGMKGLSTGKCEQKMALQTSHTMELLLDQVEVPAENLIGKEGQGFEIALAALNGGRINIGAGALGIARSAFEIAVSHANERQQFSQAIIDFQGVGFLLADMQTKIEAARGLVARAAWSHDQGEDVRMAAAMAKVFASDMAMEVTTDAVQILGGSGYTREFPVERYMREAKVLQIVEGTNQIQRLVIARGLKDRSK